MTGKDGAIGNFREFLTAGQRIYTKIEHVSQSGMSRDVSVYIAYKNEITDITHQVGQALDMRRNKRTGGLRISGYGFDAGFEVVYRLGCTLWPEGFQCIGENCPSNDHYNGDRNYSPHIHKGGGYAFRHTKL